MESKKLVIGGREFGSRLFMGTGKFSSNILMQQAIAASGTEMVTMAMKRIDMSNAHDDMLEHIKNDKIQLLPNTSGVRDAAEAVLAAQLARECFKTNFIKLEIHLFQRKQIILNLMYIIPLIVHKNLMIMLI